MLLMNIGDSPLACVLKSTSPNRQLIYLQTILFMRGFSDDGGKSVAADVKARFGCFDKNEKNDLPLGGVVFVGDVLRSTGYLGAMFLRFFRNWLQA